MAEDEVLFDEVYEILDVIRHGPSSVVRKCRHKSTGQVFAVKIIDVAKYSTITGHSFDDLQNEASICHSLKHAHIVELLETYSSEGLLYMVYEYMEGSDICSEILRKVSSGYTYSEAVASHYFRQVLEALSYCHDNNTVHRDLRPHNLFISSPDSSSSVKLMGFGAATRLNNQEFTTEGCSGDAHYSCPEICLKRSHGKSADIWSAGILLHVLLSGSLPFTGTGERLCHAVCNGEVNYGATVWTAISDHGKDLLQQLLCVDPNDRLSVYEALEHRWIKNREKCAPRVHLQQTVEEMRVFNSRNKLKSLIISVINSPKCGNSALLDSVNDAVSDVEENDSVSWGAVRVILDSVDEIQFLQDSPWVHRDTQSISEVLDDQILRSLLSIYDVISSGSFKAQRLPPSNSISRYRDAIDLLREPSCEVLELRQLLLNPHMKALLQAHDVISDELYGDGWDSGRVTPPPHLPPIFLNHQSAMSGSMSMSVMGGGPLPLTAYSNNGSGGSSLALAGPNGDIPPLDHVTRVRLVQFQRNSDEPMGITLKVTEEGHCLVARIMHGGMIHRQGTLHVGDEIREINGQPVANKTVEELQKILRDLRGSVTFKIVPSFRNAPPPCEWFRINPPPVITYVRAQFDYNPLADDLIPCAQAGIAFKTGDILQIISKDDNRWWQARKDGDDDVAAAGLVPSPELQEWRIAVKNSEKSKKEQVNCLFFYKKKKLFKDKFLCKSNANLDQTDILAYEEVVKLPVYRRKTLVLLGAHGVGRRQIKNTVISHFPDKFAYPIPHTTRQQRSDEENGKNYYFVTHDEMMADIAANEYLEYGTHEEAMYGTKLETIRKIHSEGKMAILDVEPQALKILRTAQFAPYVVFIAAPPVQNIADYDGSLERLVRESESLKSSYGHLFDSTITNNDIEETIETLENSIDTLHNNPQWVPLSWIY